jgi:hypothetical protein
MLSQLGEGRVLQLAGPFTRYAQGLSNGGEAPGPPAQPVSPRQHCSSSLWKGGQRLVLSGQSDAQRHDRVLCGHDFQLPVETARLNRK